MALLVEMCPTRSAKGTTGIESQWSVLGHEMLARLGYGVIACDARWSVIVHSALAARLVKALEVEARLVVGAPLPAPVAGVVEEVLVSGGSLRVRASGLGRSFYVSAFRVEQAEASPIVAVLIREEGTRTADALAALVRRHELSARDMRILDELRSGRSNRQIGERFGWSKATVKSYVHDVCEKLGVHSRAEAAALVHAAIEGGGRGTHAADRATSRSSR